MADRFLDGLVWFFQPLLEAVGDEVALRNLFGEFGYDLDGPAAANALQEIGAALQPVVDELSATVTSGALDPAAAVDVFTALASLPDTAAVQTLVADAAEFGLELFDYLVYRYLATLIYPASAALKALGVITFTIVAPTDPGGRDFPYRRVELRWGRLGDFIRDNGAWARDVYGWGSSTADGRTFDYALAIENLALIVESTLLGLSRRRLLPAAEADAFLANNGGATVEEVTVPFFQTDVASIDADGSPTCQNEVGLKVVPSGDVTRPEELGLAIAPYTSGILANEIALTDALTLAWSVATAAAGGAYLRFSPVGIEVVQGGAVDAGFELGFIYAKADAAPLLLAGDPGGTRLQAGALLTSVGGDLNGDLYFAGGVNDLRAVIDVSGDGFLGAIIPAPIEVDVGAITIGWRNGPGRLLRRRYQPRCRSAASPAAGADHRPPARHRAGLGDPGRGHLPHHRRRHARSAVRVRRERRDRGHGGAGTSRGWTAGTVRPSVRLQAADGVCSGAGGAADRRRRLPVRRRRRVPRRACTLVRGHRLQRLRDPQHQAARWARRLLVRRLDLRRVHAAARLRVLPHRRGRRSSASTARSTPRPCARCCTTAASTICCSPPTRSPTRPRSSTDMAAIFPSCEGQHLFGPVARLAYGQPAVISGTLGVVLEVGATFRLLILGGLASVLPDENVALIDLRLSFFGEIDFAAGTVSFDATLQGSRVLVFPVAGDIAARTGWAAGLDHVMAFGGLHPSYPRPSNLPDLRRMIDQLRDQQPAGDAQGVSGDHSQLASVRRQCVALREGARCSSARPGRR